MKDGNGLIFQNLKNAELLIPENCILQYVAYNGINGQGVADLQSLYFWYNLNMNVVNSYCTPGLAELLFNNQRVVDKTGETKMRRRNT